MIRVLIAEDSPSIREFLVHILSSDPELTVVGTAADGEEAVAATVRLKPDIITMDIHMPKMDGFEATRSIMEIQPTPIIIVSASLSVREVSTALYAMEVGALAVVSRPPGLGHPEYDRAAKELIQAVKLMSGVKVIRHWPKRPGKPGPVSVPAVIEGRVEGGIGVVAMGGSTGATTVFQTILRGLPKDFPVPVLVVQHMAAGFLPGFAAWLNESTSFPTSIAIHGESLLPGRAYVAADYFHMGITTNRRIELSNGNPENGAIPSVSHLFRSVAQVFGKHAAGVLLTGMGRDGAQELKLMRNGGALTIAQDKDTSVVFGMPGTAVELDAAELVLPPERIAPVLVSAAGRV